MKLILVLLVCAIAFQTGSDVHKKWAPVLSGEVEATDDELLTMYEDWLVHYEKDMTNKAAVMKRFTIFKDKAKTVAAFNKEGHSWKKGINPWSDLTDEEFYTLYPPMDGQECSATNT